MILGVSHLVMSSAHPDEEVTALAQYGYELSHARDDVPNRTAKAPFLFGDLPETTIMRLARSSRSFPLIEVVRENSRTLGKGEHFAPGKSGFELDLDQVETPVVTIECEDPEKAAGLWKAVGAGEISVDPNGHAVTFAGNAVCAGLRIKYVEGAIVNTPTFLNHEGLVCVAFLCRNADALRAHLDAKRFEVGKCFDLVPVETPLRLFFMRNRSGEIYEFLSLG